MGPRKRLFGKMTLGFSALIKVKYLQLGVHLYT